MSGRAVLVDVRDGIEVATTVYDYPSGVIDLTLPSSGKPLPPEWALQDPLDYIETIKQTVPNVLREGGVTGAELVGVGIDFTACTMMPVKADSTPLRAMDEWVENPHASVKLWKYHPSQPQADQINATARQMGESWLDRYGGKISSEWFFSKALQILQEAPEVYHAADRLIEAADWVIWQLTGNETRNACTAGYKAMVQDGHYPQRAYFAALHPEFADVIDTKMSREFAQLGDKAGGLTADMAAMTGLRAGTAVAVANVDAHVTPPAVKATGPGVLVMIMGTSTCHMVSGTELKEVDGMCGGVHGGIIPGLYGYEAGQSGVGDIFAWFVDHGVPPEYHQAAAEAGLNLHAYLEQEAAKQAVGEHGLVALDWWNGNRSTLVDTHLSGLLIGMTLATRAPDIYRALIESTAFGTREIIEAQEKQGVPVNELIAAGTYPNIQAAAEKMGKLSDEVVVPNPANKAAYDTLYAEYKILYDYFGRGANDAMKRLKALKREVRAATLEA